MSTSTANPWVQIAPGIKRQTITTGTTMYQMRAELDAGSVLPEHHHPQEQITHLVKGRLRFVVGGVPHELKPGESLYIGSNVPHGAETLEAATAIDTFSPPRDDYLAIDRKQRPS
jgi:quercetin dioxygenase-like cupin family protein